MVFAALGMAIIMAVITEVASQFSDPGGRPILRGNAVDSQPQVGILFGVGDDAAYLAEHIVVR
jgi:hypothetical protein